MQQGASKGLDGSRLAVAGDSVGGNMTAALTLMAKERGDVPLLQQVLFYPVTDANFDTGSYHQFAEGYFCAATDGSGFWDQYTTDEADRAQITASPLRATTEQLTGLPPALVITGEADVLRDEGEAYAGKLRTAGVPVTAVRFQGIIHDFVMLNALRGTHAAEAALDDGHPHAAHRAARGLTGSTTPTRRNSHVREHHPHRPARARCLRRRRQLVRRHRGTAEPRHSRRRAAEPAALSRLRRRVHRLGGRADRRPRRLVGHSYGGAVITVAGTRTWSAWSSSRRTSSRRARAWAVAGALPDSPLGSSLKQAAYPVEGGDPAVEVTIVPEAFPAVFAADVPADVTKVLAVAQRPLAAGAFAGDGHRRRVRPSSGPGRRRGPGDQPRGRALRREKRAGATILEVEGASHAVAVSRPKVVAELIRDAVRATG